MTIDPVIVTLIKTGVDRKSRRRWGYWTETSEKGMVKGKESNSRSICPHGPKTRGLHRGKKNRETEPCGGHCKERSQVEFTVGTTLRQDKRVDLDRGNGNLGVRERERHEENTGSGT